MLRFPAIEGPLIREKRKPNRMATGHGCQRISVTNVSTSPLLAIVVLQGAEFQAMSGNDIDPKFRHHRSTISIPQIDENLGISKMIFQHYVFLDSMGSEFSTLLSCYATLNCADLGRVNMQKEWRRQSAG